jgi:flagellar hook-associated protein 3 FlgL
MLSRIGSQQMARNFLSDLGRTQVAIADLQRQLSTGKRVSDPSDDPVGVALALNIRDDLESVRAWRQNAEDSTAWLSATDNALGNYQDVVQRAHELTVQGANGTLSADQRRLIGARSSRRATPASAGATSSAARRPTVPRWTRQGPA